MSVPTQKPGKSRQDYATPDALIQTVEARFGRITFDLAASVENARASDWYGPGGRAPDALKEVWGEDFGVCWLNPPFADIEPWAAKCLSRHIDMPYRAGVLTLLLTPASVGSNWFADYVHGRALVLALSPRLTFKGETSPYPKDCMLSVFGLSPGFDVWRWKI